MSSLNRVLAIETSCDDTSVALVESGGWVRQLLSAHQDLIHQPFGGIVPELASRDHSQHLIPLIEETLKRANLEWRDLDGLVVTARPGLLGSLLVGLVTTKALALCHSLPWLGVNHLEGHLMAPFLRDEKYQPPQDFDYPYLALAISGGHTQLYRVKALGEYEVLGRTLDDAAGEAFDKFAKLVGLGYPGGVQVDREAQSGAVDKYSFPRALQKEGNLNFSFSGLKTSAQNLIQGWSQEKIKSERAHLCASYQEAIVEALLYKLDQAAEKHKAQRIVLTGGVSANSRLRLRAQEWANRKSYRLVVPPIRYCTDNAAMIGWAGLQRLQRGERSPENLAPSARSLKGDFIELS